MSNIQTHDLKDVCAVLPGKDESPGNLVRHVKDEKSRGVVVALDPKPQGWDNQPQVTVLWSKEPHGVVVHKAPINFQPRKIRAQWSIEEEQDRKIIDAINNGEMSALEAMESDPDIKDISFSHSMTDDGPSKVKIKRYSKDREEKKSREVRTPSYQSWEWCDDKFSKKFW